MWVWGILKRTLILVALGYFKLCTYFALLKIKFFLKDDLTSSLRQGDPISIYLLIQQILLKIYPRKIIMGVFTNLSMRMFTTVLFVASVNCKQIRFPVQEGKH